MEEPSSHQTSLKLCSSCPGLTRAFHVFTLAADNDVDGRVKPGQTMIAFGRGRVLRSFRIAPRNRVLAIGGLGV